eukprot:CAMPEP_0204901500 /NCGR_PEP_ID=MMETSP1397-20131031/3118_1 /ASSEMBLY_ACC=CAM_ASM_000891 /TAXON_ID=49980 /ORGANISM="Climacostomum Climacostomum virens, Strain Stock W-24" /LENGTH=335 /DNA_ID=CAMNT_0052069867 /DNA_START=130 /DNA_END=1134 /DNA_ORIENTATION=+
MASRHISAALLLTFMFCSLTPVRATVVLNLTNYQDSQYYGNLELGTPSQTLIVQFSTASVVSWVPSSYCSTKFCFLHDSYDLGSSKTGTILPLPFTFEYYDGSKVQGKLASDVANIGGSISFDSFNFLLADVVTGYSPANSIFDGIIALGPNNVTESRKLSLIDMLIDKGLISYRVFSIYYTKGQNQNSQLILGGIDSSLYTGTMSIHYNSGPVDKWGFIVETLKVGSVNVPLPHYTIGVIDSSQAGLFFPNPVYDTVLKYTRVISNCNNLSSLPSIFLTIDNVVFEIPPAAYVLQSTGGGASSCSTPIFNNVYIDQNSWIVLGDSFLKAYYSYY